MIHPKDKSTDFLKPIYHGRNVRVITGGCTKEDVAKAIDEHDHIVMMGHGTPQGLLAMGQFNGRPKPAVKPSTAIRTAAAGKPVTSKDVKSFYTPSQTKSLLDLDDLPNNEDDWFADRKVGGGGYGYKPYHSSGSYQSLSTGYVIDDSNAEQLKGKKITAIWCNADQYMEWNELDGFYTGMFISEEGEARMIGTADTEKWQVEESNYAFVDVVRRHIGQDSETLHKAVIAHYGLMSKRNAVAKYNLKRMYCHKNSEYSRKSLAITKEGDSNVRTGKETSGAAADARVTTRREGDTAKQRTPLTA